MLDSPIEFYMQRMNRNAVDSQPQSMKMLVMFPQPLFSMKDFLATVVWLWTIALRKSMDPDSLLRTFSYFSWKLIMLNYEYCWKDAKIILDEIITENHIRDEEDDN